MRVQAVLDGPGGHLGSRSNAKLVPNPFHMAFGGSLRDEQTLSDLLAGHAGSDHRHDLAFTAAQQPPVGEPLFGRSVSNEGVVEHFSSGHGLALLPCGFAPALGPKPIVCLPACRVQLLGSERPDGQ